MAAADKRSDSRMLKELNSVKVSEIPETPKLFVKPLRRPALKEAVCHNFIRVMFVLFATRGPSPLVLREIPLDPERVKVGVN